MYEYSYTDQLGNLRLSFRDSSTAGAPPVVTQQSHLGPWGETLPALSYQNIPQRNFFDFTNHERQTDFDLELIDAKARIYDPITPRMWGQDVFAERYANFSPYNYGLNNPLRYIDPDGQEPQDGNDDSNKKGCPANCPQTITQSDATRTVQGTAAFTSYTLVRSQQVRNEYVTKVASLEKTDSKGRTQAKVEAREKTPAVMREVAENMRPISGETTRVAGTASKTNAGVNKMVGTLGTFGKVAGVASVGISVYNIATAENKPQAITTEGGAMVGAIAGGELGAEIGAGIGVWFGGGGAVPGAIIGGIIGGIGGGMSGAMAGEKAYKVVTSTTKKEDKQ